MKPSIKQEKLRTSISISQSGKRSHNKLVYAKHPVFNHKEVIADIQDDVIIFTVPTLDYQGRVHPVSDAGNGSKKIYLGYLNMNDGFYEYDQEDSNEDQLIIYLD